MSRCDCHEPSVDLLDHVSPVCCGCDQPMIEGYVCINEDCPIEEEGQAEEIDLDIRPYCTVCGEFPDEKTFNEGCGGLSCPSPAQRTSQRGEGQAEQEKDILVVIEEEVRQLVSDVPLMDYAKAMKVLVGAAQVISAVEAIRRNRLQQYSPMGPIYPGTLPLTGTGGYLGAITSNEAPGPEKYATRRSTQDPAMWSPR